MLQSPFWLLLPFKAHARHFPPAKGDREADGMEQSVQGTGQTSPCPSEIPSISLFLFFFPQLSLNDSLGLSSLSSRTVVLPLQPGFPSPEHSCSAFKRLLSHASPHRQTGLSFASASRQRLRFYLPSRAHPRGMPAPTAPLPLRSRPLAARGTRRGSLTAR